MTTARLVTTMALGWAAAGCVHSGFMKTTDLVVPARPPDCHLDVSFQGEAPPLSPYVALGSVWTNSMAPELFVVGENNVVAMRRMLEQACTVGAHGVMNAAANSQLVRVGKGHWKSTTGSAVAFVYVDASGRPLQPPPPPSSGSRGTIGQ